MEDVIENLRKTDKNTEYYTLKNFETYGKVVKVYDGDTCHINIFPPGFDIPKKFKCRLLGIDTAEKRSNDELEKQHAKKARKFFIDWIGEGIVYVKFDKFDKYGRALVMIYKFPDDEISLNDILVEKGFAYRYYGETKKTFREWYYQNKNNLFN